jgi:hypothetical protein
MLLIALCVGGEGSVSWLDCLTLAEYGSVYIEDERETAVWGIELQLLEL